VRGQLIKNITSFPNPNLRTHEVVWDGRDDNGKEINSGVYFFQIQSKDYSSDIKKMIYLQ